MIEHISVKNYATIKHINMELDNGLTVITGETGAGKSIIIGAISLAFFGRADKSIVRSGEDKAQIQVVLDTQSLADSNSNSEDSQLIITRDISATGKSLCRIDDEIIPLTTLTAKTEGLIDIHGQYDNQKLLNPVNHLKVLDSFGAAALETCIEEVHRAYDAYRKHKKSYDELAASLNDSANRMESLTYEIREIESAGLISGEDEDLKATIEVMQHSEDIHEALEIAMGALDGDNSSTGALSASALNALGAAMTALQKLENIDDTFKQMSTNLSDAYYNVEEIANICRTKLESIDFTSGSLDKAIAKYELVEELKRKYGGNLLATVDDVIEYKNHAEDLLKNLEHAESNILELKSALALALQNLKAASQKLSAERKAIAKKLEASIESELGELNFNNAEFKIIFEESKYTRNGCDNVSFHIKTGIGQPLAPINKIASGGEISRIMLAIKSITHAYSGIDTMIFDEIDSGISGVTASVVGKKLHEMASGNRSQIIVITHLPQIAAYADHHYMIDKNESKLETITSIGKVEGEDRVVEIARLLSGDKVSETTLDAARELIAASN
ncbi:MAG: DNA repair protein RecN [Clostridiales Family XIII bacterium]|jgi:DNA repair protein RecN (Recombination protein N)|nr:DNA repair protein RecN [Clostridiales Family XIII bacterium]